jgi:hypothetical protein
MIWGDVINSIRRLHLHMTMDLGIDAALFTRDIGISNTEIPMPASVDDFEEWEEAALPADLIDLLPLHPVERALIEGPLLPIQIIRFESAAGIESLMASILALEEEWMEKSRTKSPERQHAVRDFLKAEGIKLGVRAGFRKLASAKEMKP